MRYERTFVDIKAVIIKVGGVMMGGTVSRGEYGAGIENLIRNGKLCKGKYPNVTAINVPPSVVMAIRAWAEDIGYF